MLTPTNLFISASEFNRGALLLRHAGGDAHRIRLLLSQAKVEPATFTAYGACLAALLRETWHESDLFNRTVDASLLVDILPRPKGRGFLLDGDVFMPGMNTMARGPYATLWHGLRAAKSRENVDRGVDVAIMMGSAIGACPFSDTQPCSTFRTATRNVSAA